MKKPGKVLTLVEFIEQFHSGFRVMPWQRQILEEFEKHPNERLEMSFSRKRGHHYRWVPK